LVSTFKTHVMVLPVATVVVMFIMPVENPQRTVTIEGEGLNVVLVGTTAVVVVGPTTTTVPIMLGW
jgi:hypothetical protein